MSAMKAEDMDLVYIKDGIDRLTAMGYLHGEQCESLLGALNNGQGIPSVTRKLIYALMDNAYQGFQEPQYAKTVKSKVAQEAGPMPDKVGQNLQTAIRDRMVKELLETDWFIPTLLRLM